jgi:hypothetical protein
MAILTVLVFSATAGVAAYAHLHAIGVNTEGEERLALVIGFALTLVLDPTSAAEFVAELIGLGAVVLGVASLAHVGAMLLRGDRPQELAG